MSIASFEQPSPVRASHLVVDLNHTLVRTDTMIERLLRLLFTAPMMMFVVLRAAFHGRAAVKAALARLVALDAALLPYDQSVIELVRAHRAAGGQAHLISGTDPSTAEEVAEHLGIFNSVMGGGDTRSLKGARRAEYIIARLGGDFAYAGDSPTDVHVWKSARQSIIVKRVGRTLNIARHSGVSPSVVIERQPARLRDWVSALRFHQWSKNVIVLVPIVLSQQLANPLQALKALAAFLLFGVVASGTYLVNDLADLAADRKHPTKRLRPICAGRISLTHAALAAVLLVGGGLAAASFSAPLFYMLAGYTALTLSYSFALKREMLTDVLVIGVLFLLRVACGMVAIGQPASLWLCAFTVMLFTSLATAKRHGEVIRAAKADKKLAGRDYVAQDAPLTAAVGLAAASGCTLLMLLYMQFEAAGTGLYHDPRWLFLIPIVLASWLLRVWSKAHRGTLHDDPVVFALKDRVSWLHAGLVAGLWGAAVVAAP